MLEGIPELTLHTPVNELIVLCETIVDFKNLKDNDFDFTETLNVQGWNTFFERLTCPIYTVLVKQFWVHAIAERETITSYITNRKIFITEKSIADLIGHDGKGKRVHSATITAKSDDDISPVIFKEETNFAIEKGPSVKELIRNLGVWFKIILGCINHRPNTNSFDYINTRQKVKLFLLEKGVNLGLSSLLFKFIRDSIRESRTGGSSKKARSKFIPNGRLISDILVENGLVDDLLVSGLIEKLVKDVGKVLWGKNMKSMGIISLFQRPNVMLTKDDIWDIRNPLENYPIFTKIDPPQVLMAYLESCLKDEFEPLVDPFNLQETYRDVHGKRKKEFRGEGSSRAQNKNNITIFQDEDAVPLSEHQKAMILKDTSGVVQSSRFSGKLPSDSASLDSDSMSSRILRIPLPSQSTISEPIPIPPPESNP
ncbi:uncharacterized protein LOC127104400 [Lathyrus oleraceus]|uniref:uncharacterized protein LOC127104400 n=1 Tax=Pisum sativum TaxID=3888 RepID=UPI0021CFCB50|nr:uncharacterized protein LOC127104400 [Pisum sativum]